MPDSTPQEPATAAPQQSLAQVAAAGTAWLAGATLLTQVFAFASGLVVARYVGPDAYGAAAIALSVTGLAASFNSLGLQPAVATGRLKEPEALSTAQWFMAATGLAFGALAMASASVVARFFHNPAVAPVLRVAVISLIVEAWGVVPSARLQHRGMFALAATANTGAQLFTALAAVGMSVAGAGVWALVVPPVLGSLLRVRAAWYLSDVKLSTRASLRSIRPFLAEGVDLIGLSLSNFTFRNADNVVVGRTFSPADLGRYTFAYSLLMRPLGLLNGAVSDVLLPMLGRVRDDLDRFDRGVSRTIVSLARVSFPIFLGGAFTAAELIHGLLGPRWAGTVPLLRIFFTIGAAQSIGGLSGIVWLTLGRSRLLLLWGMCTGVGAIGVYIVGALLGSPEAVALCFSVYSGLILAPPAVYITRKVCGLRLPGAGSGLLRVLRDVAGMLIAVWLVRTGLARAGAPAGLQLAIEVPVGALVYATLFRFLSPAEARTLLDLAPARLRGPVARALRLN